MKYSYLKLSLIGLIILVFILISCSDDNPLSPNSRINTFTKHVDLHNYEQLEVVLENQDGSFVSGGRVQIVDIDSSGPLPDTTYDFQAMVIKFKSNGDTIWTCEFGEPTFSEFVTALGKGIDNNYIAASPMNPPVGGMNMIRSQMILEDGVPDLTTYHSIKRRHYINDMTCTFDGSYFLAGYTNNLGEPYSFYIIKLNQSGSEIWDREYSSTDTLLYPTKITQLPDSTILILGFYEYSSAHGIAIMKINLDGDVLLSVKKQLINYHYFHCIKSTDENGFVVAGHIENLQSRGTFVLTLDSLGNIKASDYNYLSNYFYINDGQFTPDGGVIMCGNTAQIPKMNNSYLPRPIGDGYLIKLNSSGDIAWEKSYEYDSLGVNLLGVTASKDGGYITVGESRKLPEQISNMIIIKTDKNGIVE